ncbi:zinc ribbon domain-containing protein [Alistipes finegoldii]|jgi:DNA-directed RNA polymerase subunit RPC12/RpoP|uniref:zinc ribbon domain-containing protein n=1 Tax=Alistipes finegoldii TaxID=214856 RepID=UPI0024318F3B|nr:zinc ribbon domain-containing protein [Alistipes finegoldii]
MSLVKCPECGKEISNQAASCPNCGMPMQQATVKPVPISHQSEDLLHCPKCKSINLHVDKKGFSGGKAIAGAVVAGGIGILAGTIGSRDINITCLKCGHNFNPLKDLKEKQKRERRLKEQKQNEEMWRENPLGMIIMLICISLSMILLFASEASIWWSVLLIILAVVIPLFTRNIK